MIPASKDGLRHRDGKPQPDAARQSIFRSDPTDFPESQRPVPVNIGRHVAYAANYHNVLATASGDNAHIHPSEPNYLWSEAGFNFNIFDDADPFVPQGGPTVNQVNEQENQLHLVRLLTRVAPPRRHLGLYPRAAA
jgi:hypothetical protein